MENESITSTQGIIRERSIKMQFNKLLGIQECDSSHKKINTRLAVRAVILQNNNLLLVHSNLGDYKFPGGGVEQEEGLIEALIREVKEETGYTETTVLEKIGVVTERFLDEYEPDSIFEMTSHYYLCEITEVKETQQLDDYELEQEYTPVWIDIEEALAQNEKALEMHQDSRWIHRENYVLQELLKRSISMF